MNEIIEPFSESDTHRLPLHPLKTKLLIFMGMIKIEFKGFDFFRSKIDF
jgi:hypothetical protein